MASHSYSKENISDILTRGVTPDKLGPGSTWQCGPAWLTGPASDWPVTSNDDTANEVLDRGLIAKLSEFYHKKSRSLVVNLRSNGSKVVHCVQTFVSGAKTDQVQLRSGMDHSGIDGLICRCGSLEKLIRCVHSHGCTMYDPLRQV